MAESDENGRKRIAACQSRPQIRRFPHVSPTLSRQPPSALDDGSSINKTGRESVETNASDQSDNYTISLPDDFHRRLMVSLAKRAAREDYERSLREG
jgi:hypothetical protein